MPANNHPAFADSWPVEQTPQPLCRTGAGGVLLAGVEGERGVGLRGGLGLELELALGAGGRTLLESEGAVGGLYVGSGTQE